MAGKRLLLIAALTLTAAAAKAQCHCEKLRLAMADGRSYRYRYYRLGTQDATEVELLTPADQQRYGRSGSVGHQESYGVYDPATGQMRMHKYDERLYLLVPLSQLHPGKKCGETTVQVEVTDVATGRRMRLRFSRWRFDEQYNLLVDFVPGRHYRLDLRPLGTFSSSAKRQFASGFHLTSEAGSNGSLWLRLRRP